MACKHGTCKNFKVLSGKGRCERDKKSVDSMMSGCENWGELSELKHPLMKRGAMFCGVVTQKSLLDVVVDRSKVGADLSPVPAKEIVDADSPEVKMVKEAAKAAAGLPLDLRE